MCVKLCKNAIDIDVYHPNIVNSLLKLIALKGKCLISDHHGMNVIKRLGGIVCKNCHLKFDKNVAQNQNFKNASSSHA